MELTAKLWIPDSIEEARRVVPDIDEEQYIKWRREGAVELRLLEVYRLKRDSFITTAVLRDRTWVPDYELVEPREVEVYPPKTKTPVRVLGWLLYPDQVYILKLQYVSIPRDLLPTDVQPRSSFHRLGWDVKVTNIDPGFKGHVYVALFPMPGAPTLILEKGARVVQVRFLKLERELEGYEGQWQGR